MLWCGHGVAARRRRVGRAAPGGPRTADPARAGPRASRRASSTAAVLDVLASGGAYFFRPLVRRRRRPARRPGRRRRRGRRSGTSSGPGCSRTTPWRRCAPGSAAAAPRTARGRRPRARGTRAARRLREQPPERGPARDADPQRPADGRRALVAAAPSARPRPPSGPHAVAETAARPARRRHPRRRRRRARARRLRRRLPRAARPSRTPAGSGAATSSRASAPRSSPRPVPSTGCAPLARPPATEPDAAPPVVLAAADPANPYGAALPWPDAPARRGERLRAQHRPGRKAGALVVLRRRRAGRSTSSAAAGRCCRSPTSPSALQAAADALALAVREGALGRLTVERADGEGLLGSGHPLALALEAAGFHATPRGLRSALSRPASCGPEAQWPVPEGDVVWRAAHRLNAALAGRVLTAVRPALALAGHGRPERARRSSRSSPAASTCWCGSARRRRPLTLHSHLRMEGSWHVHRTGDRWRSAGGAERHPGRPRRTTSGPAVGHKLGMLDLVPTARRAHPGRPPRSRPARRRLGRRRRCCADAAPRSRSGRSARPCSTSATSPASARSTWPRRCSCAGSRPWTPVADVPDLPAVVALAHKLLDVNRVRGVQVTTGDTRPGRANYVHGRSGRPCLRCGTPIRVALDRRRAAGPGRLLLPALPARTGSDGRRPSTAPDGRNSAALNPPPLPRVAVPRRSADPGEQATVA